MNSLIGLGVLGTFGQPFGYQQTFYLGAGFTDSLDLDENAIEIYPGHELYAVRKELVEGVYTIGFCIYSHVKELYSDRTGTFIGTCIVLQDGYADAEYIYKILRELHDDTISNTQNIEDDTIKVQQAQHLIVREPVDFPAVRANVIPISKTPFYSTHVDEGKKYLVEADHSDKRPLDEKVTAFFDESLKYYTDASSMYFTFDNDVAAYVAKKDLIDSLDWSEFANYKSRHQQQGVVRTKKGIQKQSDTQSDDFSPPEDASVVPTNTETDLAVDPENEDPNKPFDIWDDPDRGWTKDEAKSKTKEYNRLFRYTSILVNHVNDSGKSKNKKLEAGREAANGDRPAKNGKSVANRKRGILILVIAGFLCLFGGFYNFFFSKTNQTIISTTASSHEPTQNDDPPVRPLSQQPTQQEVAKSTTPETDRPKTKAIAKIQQQPAAEPKKVLPEEYVPDEPAPAVKKAATASNATPLRGTHARANNIVVKDPPVATPPPVKQVAISPNITPLRAAYVNRATLLPLATAQVPDTTRQHRHRRQGAAPLTPAPIVSPADTKGRDLKPAPNFEMTQKDIAVFANSGVKNKTLTEIVRIVFSSVPTNVGNVYKGQEAEYASMLLGINSPAFQKNGNDYVCTADYVILHIPAYKNPRLPVIAPK
jgi:cytoskeletal protein RodZ